MAADRALHNPTLEDVARAAGVSTMTASRALRGAPAVHPRTRERIVQHAQSIGYRPHRWARSLVHGRSWIIGIVIPDISHTYFAEITAGVEDAAEMARYDLLLCHSRSDPNRERAEIEMLLESRVDGLIVASEQGPEMFRILRQRGVPFVLIDRSFPHKRLPSAGVDNLAVGRMAADHLVALGHRRIAHIRGPKVSTAELRFVGFRDALARHGLPLTSRSVAVGSFDIAGGREAMRALLRQSPRPTAVFAANDPMAFGAVRACREASLRVPEDVSVFGAGNIEGDDHPRPFLTTSDWPRRDLGRAAAALLAQLIANPRSAVRDVVFPPRLLVRQSTARPPARPR